MIVFDDLLTGCFAEQRKQRENGRSLEPEAAKEIPPVPRTKTWPERGQ